MYRLREKELQRDLHADDGVNEEKHRDEQDDIGQRLHSHAYR